MSADAIRFNPFLASVFRKQLIALTGLMMCGFLIVHLAGNLLLFKGPEIFNQYAFFMLSHPLVMMLEWVLVLLFLSHALLGLKIIADNRKARPVAYVMRVSPPRRGNFSLVSMSVTGPAILVFLILHLFHFRLGDASEIQQGGVVMRDLYGAVVSFYKDPLNLIFYVAAMMVLALHLHHGFWSAFQSFGIYHPRYNRVLELAADFFGMAMLIGFSVIPVYFFLQGGG